MKVLQRGNVHELQLDHGDPDHRFRLARAFLMEAADNGAWRVFVGMPEDWQLFAKALQGIEGGTLLHATGDGLEPIVRHYPVHRCEFEWCHRCKTRQLVTAKQLTTGLCEYCEPAPVRTHGPRDLSTEIRA